MAGDQCPACGGAEVLGHEDHEVCDGVLFWSCTDCGFAWPRFIDPLTAPLVLASVEAARDYMQRTSA